MIGPSIPPPATSPRTAVAGSPALVPGSGIPFTVAVSDGSSATATGHPLLGPEMDGIPVLVLAFADFDGDGVIGPTSADDAGGADDARELQESDYLIGRQVSLFHNGVAQGTLYIWKGAPASAGGLRVVLTAIAYVGSFSPSFFFGSVPDGPPVATRLPFFPRYDPDHVVEANGRGGPAEPAHRLGIELEPAFEPPVNDPDLGTPFALPTDGSSPTLDRVAVAGGPMSRLRCVRPSSAAGFPVGAAVPLYRGAAGALYEDLTSVDVPDNGRGTAVPVRLVPVDAFDNVTDPPAGAQATLIAGPGLVIAEPDTDGDPTRETVPIGGADGVGGGHARAVAHRARHREPRLRSGPPLAARLPRRIAGRVGAVGLARLGGRRALLPHHHGTRLRHRPHDAGDRPDGPRQRLPPRRRPERQGALRRCNAGRRRVLAAPSHSRSGTRVLSGAHGGGEPRAWRRHDRAGAAPGRCPLRGALSMAPLALRPLRRGQIEDEAGAVRDRGVERDGAAVALDDLPHDGEADAGSRRLRRHEEPEDALAHLRGHAGARVGELHTHAPGAVAGCRGADRDPAARPHRLDRVDDQLLDRLTEVGGVGPYERQVRRDIEVDGHTAGLEPRREGPQQRLDQRRQVRRLDVRLERPREIEDAADVRLELVHLYQHVLQVLVHRLGRRDLLEAELGGEPDAGERVADAVRHSRGQLADRGQVLGAGEALVRVAEVLEGRGVGQRDRGLVGERGEDVDGVGRVVLAGRIAAQRA